MLNKSQIINCICAVTLAYDLYASLENKKRFNKLLERKNTLDEQLDHAIFAANYMAQKLADNEIDLSEFDIIALNNPI